MNKLKFTQLQTQILNFLFMHAGRQFSARSIAKHLDVSPPGISKALSGLEKTELINVMKDPETKRLSISLNRNNPLAIQIKRAENLKAIYLSGLAEALELAFPGRTIIMFGSYSRGDDMHDSDIDIAVIGGKEKSFATEEYGRELGREISLNFYEHLENLPGPLRKNILSGIHMTGGYESHEGDTKVQ